MLLSVKGARDTDLTDQHQIGGFPEGGFGTQPYCGQSVFEEQVFAEKQDDAGHDATSQHDEDTGHGPDPQWIRLVQTVYVRPFQTGNPLIPELRKNSHYVVRRDHSGGEREKGFPDPIPSLDDEPFSLKLVQKAVRAVLKN
jgi:hypothetical protein